MKLNEDWRRKPKEGFEFIYRYYDEDQKSYIGHTKQSLFLRAGGKTGRNYTRTSSKFQNAIIQKGFEAFEYEILDEVPMEEADKKEKYYIEKYDSKRNGYNSTYGGTIYFDKMNKKVFTVDLKTYNENQISTLKNNIIIFLHIKEKGESISTILKNTEEIITDFSTEEMITDFSAEEMITGFSYNYYAFEGEYINIPCHPVVLLFNFIEVMTKYTFNSELEIIDAMRKNEILGGDLLTSQEYSILVIKLINGETVSFQI